jgi:hypothetical protein
VSDLTQGDLIESGSITDPDPKPWFTEYHCVCPFIWTGSLFPQASVCSPPPPPLGSRVETVACGGGGANSEEWRCDCTESENIWFGKIQIWLRFRSYAWSFFQGKIGQKLFLNRSKIEQPLNKVVERTMIWPNLLYILQEPEFRVSLVQIKCGPDS